MTKYIGLDVHKETVAVAIAEGERRGEVRYLGPIANDDDAVRRLVKRLAGDGAALSFCYEAGPCGYGLQRLLTKLGQPCIVIAPLMMPRRPGDQVKTDRRDAMTLARLLRAGELDAIWVPEEAHEAVRDLIRARRTAQSDAIAAKQSVRSFLLRHDRRFGPVGVDPGVLGLAVGTALRLHAPAARVRGAEAARAGSAGPGRPA